MDEQLVGSLKYGEYKADIFSTSMPGEFKVIYHDPRGNPVVEAPLTGISSYKQREREILDNLKRLSDGAKPPQTPDQGDAGEY